MVHIGAKFKDYFENFVLTYQQADEIAAVNKANTMNHPALPLDLTRIQTIIRNQGLKMSDLLEVVMLDRPSWHFELPIQMNWNFYCDCYRKAEGSRIKLLNSSLGLKIEFCIAHLKSQTGFIFKFAFEDNKPQYMLTIGTTSTRFGVDHLLGFGHVSLHNYNNSSLRETVQHAEEGYRRSLKRLRGFSYRKGKEFLDQSWSYEYLFRWYEDKNHLKRSKYISEIAGRYGIDFCYDLKKYGAIYCKLHRDTKRVSPLLEQCPHC